jgi:hypothetical protein
MKLSKYLNPKTSLCLIGALLLAASNVINAQTININGTTPPVPGANDQSQTNMPSGANQPPGLNYYFDNGNAPSQTFTAGNNTGGYTLTSLAIYDAGGSGGGFTSSAQTFTLYIYNVSGTTASTLASYTSQSLTIPDARWFTWTNLGVVLQPNTKYAWSMHRNGSGWANVGNVSGDKYADPSGAVCSIPTGGGTINYGSGSGYDAAFDVGLTPITLPAVGSATFSPYSITLPGTTITASATVAGPGPFTYQWKTDGGSGGALTNIPGATSSNLVINTTGYAVGNYLYQLAVTNGSGGTIGQAGVLTVQQPTGISGVIGVKFGFASGYATTDAPFPADNTGVATGQLVPPSNVPLTAVGNWNNLSADVPAAGGDKSAAINQTWTIAQDSTGTALTGVTLTPLGFDDGWFSGGTECAAGRLLYDCWKLNTANGMSGAVTWPYNYATLTFSNLPGSAYDVFVYINDNNNNYWGNVEANGVFAVGNSFDLTPYGFNGASSDPCGSSPQFHTAAGFGSPANYVRMRNVSASGGIITITAAFDDRAIDFGVSAVELVPAQDIIVAQDTLPTYAETVVGDQVVFTAAFSNSPAVNLQWQQVSGGVTNNVNSGVVTTTNSGVVTSTLTIANVLLSNAGSYSLKAVNAANSTDFGYSSAAQLLVFNPPSATNGVAIFEDAETGANFYPPWSITTNSDLIFGFQNGGGAGAFAPGTGNFGLDGCVGDPTILTDGTLGDSKATMVSCGPNGGAGSTITYYLQTNSAPLGFEVTNIQVYGGWTDAGRRNQDYQVSYATSSDSTNFISLGVVRYIPANPSGAQIATRTMLVPATGVLAHNVVAVTIDWSQINDLNGYAGYSEIAINGTNSTAVFVPVLPVVTAITSAGGNLNVNGTGGTPNANYTWLGTTDLTPPINWVPVAQGVLSGAGALSSSLPMTNSTQMFFRLRMP